MRPSIILCRRIGGALWPADGRAGEMLSRIPQRSAVAVRIMRSRSHAQLAMYWGVLEQVVAATGRWRTAEELHIALKVATGHVDIVQLIDGRMVKVPGSIAFDHMNQDEAQAYYDAAFRVICDEVMGGIGIEELLAHTTGRLAA